MTDSHDPTPQDHDLTQGSADFTASLPASFRRLLPAARWEAWPSADPQGAIRRSSRHVVKVRPLRPAPAPRLQQERERLRWLAGRLPAPTPLAYEEVGGAEYLAMTRLRGMPMSDPDALLHPERMISLLARALRELHALPVRECPFTATLAHSLRAARERVAAGLVPGEGGRNPVEAFNSLARRRPPPEDLVVTHGRLSLEHVLVQGEYVSGLVGVRGLGIADRWVDLAPACRELRRAFGEGADQSFLEIYGLRPDPDKLAYYEDLTALG